MMFLYIAVFGLFRRKKDLVSCIYLFFYTIGGIVSLFWLTLLARL